MSAIHAGAALIALPVVALLTWFSPRATLGATPSCCEVPMPKLDGIGDAPAKLMPGLGSLHHSVKTENIEAQKFFDQGLTLIYAFNFPEAYRSFREAARLDPHLAMAYWGMALALGPNYNDSDDLSLEHDAMIPMRQAIALKPYASPEEQSLIDALSHRLSDDPKVDLTALDRSYADAMRAVYMHNPTDVDIATLFVESLMELHPWKLWAKNGQPAPDTVEIISILQETLGAYPDHLGLNHLYIHAVEASPHPEMGLACADRIPRLAPAAGHILHMPAHIYMRIGEYESAATCNIGAIEADKAYFAANGGMTDYGMYLAHNTSFLCSARAMQGNYNEAKAAADEFAGMASHVVNQTPGAEGLMALPILVDARFHIWRAVARQPEPKTSYPVDHAYWVYAQGLAAAARDNAAVAASDLESLNSVITKLPAMPGMQMNADKDVLQVAAAVLSSQVSRARGDSTEEIKHLRHAVALQDDLAYDEPEPFYYPVRESLGSALLRVGKYSEAESVFRSELKLHPHSGRALCGLTAALKETHKTADAVWANVEFMKAWRHADLPINAEEL